MSDVTEKILDRKHLTAIELTDQDLEKVNGGQFFDGGCFPFFGFGSSFALTSLAFAGGFGGFW